MTWFTLKKLLFYTDIEDNKYMKACAFSCANFQQSRKHGFMRKILYTERGGIYKG